MKPTLPPPSRAAWLSLIGLALAILAVFVFRTALAHDGTPPRLFDLFDTFTLLGSLGLLVFNFRRLRRLDWLTGLAAGGLLGALLPLATLYSPYPPIFGALPPGLHALWRGVSLNVACWGGLATLRLGAPVTLRFAQGDWRRGLKSLGFGALVGIPLAAINAAALALINRQPVRWQSPFAAALDALQPGVGEEIVYRLALLGLFWLILRRGWGDRQAAWLAGGLALLVHNYAHFDALFVEQPLFALGYGAVVALLWGVPPTLLALRRDLESAVGFHWMQDAIRFWAGF